MRYSISKSLALLVFFFISYTSSSQGIELDSGFLYAGGDSLSFQTLVQNDPNKAALYSAILPGLGQVYNKQAWKVPIIYGGAIAFAHLINFNNDLYHQFRTAQISVIDSDENTINPFEAESPGNYSSTNISRLTENFRRNRDFMIILAGAFYLVNIAEAHIAAHLKEFDVNRALSLSIEPSIQSSPLISRTTGLSLVIRF